MPQSVNAPALIASLSLLTRPSLALPHVSVPTISNIKWNELRDAGIVGVVFDKDNTVTAPYADNVHESVADSLAECKDTFGEEAVLIMSNSAGSSDDPGFVEATRLESTLGVRVLKHGTKKPNGAERVVEYFESVGVLCPHATTSTTTSTATADAPTTKTNAVPNATNDARTQGSGTRSDSEANSSGGVSLPLAFVGDRVLTDVVFGNRAGMLSVHLTRVLTLENDNAIAVRLRPWESRLVAALRRWGVVPPPHPAHTTLARSP